MSRYSVFAAAMLSMAVATAARADVTISTDTTQNMVCSAGVCAPTASSAVLNVNDLEGYLASGNVEVTTTGSGGVQANNIDIEAALTWSTASALSLVASKAITVDQPVSVTGVGGLSITNDGQNEHFAFGSSGNISFANLSSSLTINGAAYTLVNSVKSLASAIANNSSGYFALASAYNASQDGTYSTYPISTDFKGTFEGLGNTISYFSMKAGGGAVGGFFSYLDGAVVRDFGLTHARVLSRSGGAILTSFSTGAIIRCYVTGSIAVIGKTSSVGGLVPTNEGLIEDSHSSAEVFGGKEAVIGNIAAENYGSIIGSFATGTVKQRDGGPSHGGPEAGGLVGQNEGTITNSYAVGSITVGSAHAYFAEVGGLIGENIGDAADSYSIGAVRNGAQNHADTGGLIGADGAPQGSLSDTYWDTDTSGISNLSQGAGYPKNDPGITGLTSAQLRSGLPAGFDPTIWAENPPINNGLPYLINNPPPQ